MNSTTLPRSNKIIESGLNNPAISFILPFEPKMTPKSVIVDQLKSALEKIQQEVVPGHKDHIGVLVMHKLRNLVRNLNFSTYKKSIAIYVSPLFEKVSYLDIPVEPRIMINEPFDIRGLIFAKKQTREYLVLALGNTCSSIYLGKELRLTKLKANTPYSSLVNKVGSKQQLGLGDQYHRAEKSLETLIESSDRGLSALFQAYPLPVFAIGPGKILKYFKANTTNKRLILEFDHAFSDIVSERELLQLVKPYLSDWRKVKMKYLRQQLDMAMHTNMLATGIGNVWKMAAENKGRKLLIENDYRYSAQLLESTDGLYTSKEPYHKFSHIRDAVDDIIEIVLENGGDVEFVDKGLLNDAKHIALLQ